MSKQESGFQANACCQQLGDLLDPRLFKALCDPNRLALLVQLSQCGPSCTVSQAQPLERNSLKLLQVPGKVEPDLNWT